MGWRGLPTLLQDLRSSDKNDLFILWGAGASTGLAVTLIEIEHQKS